MSTTGTTSGLVQHWLGQLKQGHPEARSKLIEMASKRMKKMASRMLKDYSRLRPGQGTSDIEQATHVRFISSSTNITATDSKQFMSLLSAMMRNVLIDLCRRHFGDRTKTARPTIGSLEESFPLGQDPPAFDKGEPANIEAWTMFHEAVGRLPGKEKEVFELHYYLGRTWAEISRILAIKPDTARKWWGRAKELLSKALTGHYPTS